MVEAAETNRQNIEDVEQQLRHHWMLDPTAAHEAAKKMGETGPPHLKPYCSLLEVAPEAVAQRDNNREEVRKIITGESDKALIVVGPCSLDTETDYTEFLDYIEELQAEHQDALIVLRANGAKPRTSGGYTGMFNSIDPDNPNKLLDIYQAAFMRGIPIFTEITNTDEFGRLAPYLSGAWLGARDMMSTSLRNICAATRLPIFLKNGVDGKAETVKNAVKAVGLNSAQTGGSGVNLGLLTYPAARNGLPLMSTVGDGNRTVGIIAHGYDLPETDGPRIKKRKMLQHLGSMCTLAAELNTIVLIDGSHGVPAMASINKEDGNRFPQVIDIIIKAARQGRISNFHRVRGLVGEVGTSEGHSIKIKKTDKNMLINPDNKKRISKHIKSLRFLRLAAGTLDQ